MHKWLSMRASKAGCVRRLGAYALAVLLLCLQGQAFAQTCAPLTPVQNPTFAGGVQDQALNIPPYWSATLGASQGGTGILGIGWYYSGTPGLAFHFNDYAPGTAAGIALATSGYNSFQQTVQGGVTGGSIIQFELRWYNSTTDGTFQPASGNRSQLDVVYAGTTYATFFTTEFGALTANKAAPESSGGATVSTAPNWTTLPDVVASANSETLVQITLPAGVPANGQLMFQSRRHEVGSAKDPSSGTDDFAIENIAILSPSLCLVKQSTGDTGAFGFTVTGADTNLATAGVQSAAAVTTTAANTPAAFDAWTDNAASGFGASLRTTPMVVSVAGQPITVTETVPTQFRLTGVTCTGGGAANLAGNTATITGVAATAAPTVCTFTNAALADLQITKTNTAGKNSNVDQVDDSVPSGDTTTYTLTVRNAGPSSVTDAVVRDTPQTGIACAGTNPVTITGSGVPPGNFTVGHLTSANGIKLGTLGVNEAATLSFQCRVN